MNLPTCEDVSVLCPNWSLLLMRRVTLVSMYRYCNESKPLQEVSRSFPNRQQRAKPTDSGNTATGSPRFEIFSLARSHYGTICHVELFKYPFFAGPLLRKRCVRNPKPNISGSSHRIGSQAIDIVIAVYAEVL
jgi:hypothetical protein